MAVDLEANWSCLLYGNLTFTYSGLALKFCGKILKLLRLRILEFYRFKALNFTILRLVESTEFYLYKFAVKAVDACRADLDARFIRKRYAFTKILSL